MIIKSKSHNYDVTFVDDFKETLNYSNALYIVDKNVESLYNLEYLKPKIVIESNEDTKTLESINTLLIDVLKSYAITKNTYLVAIGGGVIQDIVSFIASILFRGINWIFYPTTLLAQADSCIGSKTSINVGNLKNQVGTFHPPTFIIIDTKFLQTLQPELFYSGLGEIIKVSFLTNTGFWYRNIDETIKHSLNCKKKFVEQDEYDTGYRNLLNYGHTFGHAIESATNFKVSHGLAVITGMDITNYISIREGYLNLDEYNIMNDVLEFYMPEFRLSRKEKKSVLKNLQYDKKNVSIDKLTMILTKKRGSMFKKEIQLSRVKDLFEEYCSLRDI